MTLLDKVFSLFEKICDWGQRNPETVGFIFVTVFLCVIWLGNRLLNKQNTATVTPHGGRTNEALEMTPSTSAPSGEPSPAQIAPPNSERRLTRSQTRAATTPPEGVRQRAQRTPGGSMGYASTSSPGVNRWSSYVDEPGTSSAQQRRPQNVPRLNLSGVEPEIPTDEQIKKKGKRTNLDEWLEQDKY